MNYKISFYVLLSLIIGCASSNILKFSSISDAFARTKSNCHYTFTTTGVIRESYIEGKIDIEYSGAGKALIQEGWSAKSLGGGVGSTYILWEKCRG